MRVNITCITHISHTHTRTFINSHCSTIKKETYPNFDVSVPFNPTTSCLVFATPFLRLQVTRSCTETRLPRSIGNIAKILSLTVLLAVPFGTISSRLVQIDGRERNRISTSRCVGRELSSLRHESTWIVLWNNQVELWRLESPIRISIETDVILLILWYDFETSRRHDSQEHDSDANYENFDRHSRDSTSISSLHIAG